MIEPSLNDYIAEAHIQFPETVNLNDSEKSSNSAVIDLTAEGSSESQQFVSGTSENQSVLSHHIASGSPTKTSIAFTQVSGQLEVHSLITIDDCGKI